MKYNFLKYLGSIFLALITVIPIIYWTFAVPFSDRFINLNATTASLGQITGLLGLAMFSLVMILGARYKMIDILFNGVADLNKKHHFIGSLSFVLLLLHPLFLVVRYFSFSMESAVNFFFFSNNWPRNFGILSLLIMIISFLFIYYIKVGRKIWLLSHQFLGLAFLLGAAHTFYLSSTFSVSPNLKHFMSILWALALYSGIYKIIKNIIKRRRCLLDLQMKQKQDSNHILSRDIPDTAVCDDLEFISELENKRKPQ